MLHVLFDLLDDEDIHSLTLLLFLLLLLPSDEAHLRSRLHGELQVGCFYIITI